MLLISKISFEIKLIFLTGTLFYFLLHHINPNAKLRDLRDLWEAHNKFQLQGPNPCDRWGSLIMERHFGVKTNRFCTGLLTFFHQYFGEPVDDISCSRR